MFPLFGLLKVLNFDDKGEPKFKTPCLLHVLNNSNFIIIKNNVETYYSC